MITPEEANRAGIEAEAPVFISPYATKRQCRECRTVFSPLVYQSGHEVTPHHFCKDEGGIYHYYGRAKPFTLDLSEYGFIADVEPTGVSADTDKFGGRSNAARSEKVFVRGISANCVADSCNRQNLEQGIVVEKSRVNKIGFNTSYFEPLLAPICGLDSHPEFNGYGGYEFRAIEGHLLFSKMDSNGGVTA